MTGGVPNMVSAMLDELDRRPGAWDKVRLESLSYGGGPPSSSLPEEARQRAPRASASQGYGLTGASLRLYPAVGGTDGVTHGRRQRPTRLRLPLQAKTTSLVSHILPAFRQAQPDRPTPALAGPTSCGLAALAVRIKIIPPTHDGPASSAPSLAPGETGEICIHGPNVALGYWRDEEATRKAFDDEGWFRSCVLFFPSGPACMSLPVDHACRVAEATSATSTKRASSTFLTAQKTSCVPSSSPALLSEILTPQAPPLATRSFARARTSRRSRSRTRCCSTRPCASAPSCRSRARSTASKSRASPFLPPLPSYVVPY